MNAKIPQLCGRSPGPFCGVLLAILSALNSGCQQGTEFKFDQALDHYQAIATEIEVPADPEPISDRVQGMPAPLTAKNQEPDSYWEMTLEEAIQIALSDSEVLRDAGVRVLNAPTATVPTVYDPAIRESDPRFGPEAALSAFDAQFDAALFFEHNEHRFNNILAGGGSAVVDENKSVFQAEISKIAATGSEFALRNITNYNRNNALLNFIPSTFDTLFEGEIRQPLLQGAGIEFNRIAGPNARPGQYNGVLIGRVNTDITLAEFEQAVRDQLYDVERAYWDLYFAYHNLNAKKKGRQAALETWRDIRTKLAAGNSTLEHEAQARAQYYMFNSQVLDALSGTAVSGRVVTTTGGVYSSERKLRSLLGLPANDGRLIRPADAPQNAETLFDWQRSLQDALWRRVELRKQRWQIRKRELELIAARNFTKMRFDLVGKYRFPGFGDLLLGAEGIPQGSAFADLFEGGRREWTVGMQLSTPVGNRIGYTAMRNAEWTLTRERAILREQELQVANELSGAFSELDRSFLSSVSDYNRRVATRQQVDEIRKKYNEGKIPLEFLLTALRQAVQADASYHRSLVDYSLAIAQVSKSRGTLLDYYNVHLNEGPWSEKAHLSALKQSRRFRPAITDHRCTIPLPVSAGEYQRSTDVQPIVPTAPSEEVAPPANGGELPDPMDQADPPDPPVPLKLQQPGGFSPPDPSVPLDVPKPQSDDA